LSGRSAPLFTLLLALVVTGCSQADRPAAAPAPAQAASPAATDPTLESELMAVVNELASPGYEGRRSGTEGGRRARVYVENAFREIGLEPAGTNGYLQPFRFKTTDDAANVLGRIPGTDPAAKAIVITAHYDHDGIKDGQIYPGADDNASGVAALLAIARRVKASPLRHPVIVAALDAEEEGLQGAKAFVAAPPLPIDRIALNMNFDMLSRNDTNEIYAAGTYHYPALRPILERVAQRSAVTLRFGHDRPKPPAGGPEDWTTESDHAEFHKVRIPFVYFGVEDHPDYHKPTDTADKIDPKFFGGVVRMLLDAVRTLDGAIP
jgi:hypothetical protein